MNISVIVITVSPTLSQSDPNTESNFGRRFYISNNSPQKRGYSSLASGASDTDLVQPNTQKGSRMNLENLNPHYVTGFSDGESCFMITITKDINRKTGSIVPKFTINLHKKDMSLLTRIKSIFFGVGSFRVVKENSVVYSVESRGSAPRFNKCSYTSLYVVSFDNSKTSRFSWQSVWWIRVNILPEGLNEILSIKASINTGFSDKLKTSFPDIIKVERPLIKPQNIDPNSQVYWSWGLFLIINISKAGNVQLRFEIAQHGRDFLLMKSLEHIFKCGSVYGQATSTSTPFVVTKFADIVDKIVPFLRSILYWALKA